MEELLKQLGLDANEAKIYMALLELGPSVVTEITKKAGITRTLGYLVLEKLEVDGLVSRLKDGGKKIKYAAEHPGQVVQFVRNKKSSWEQKIAKAEKLLPDLVSLYKTHDKPVLRYEEGVRGLESLFEETLTSTSEILAMIDVESWEDPVFLEWVKEHNRERNKRQVTERILLLDSPASRKWIENYLPTKFTQYRFVTREQAKGLLEFGGELNVYESKVLIGLPKKEQRSGVVIESAVFAGILRSLFEIVWSMAQPVRLANTEKAK